MNFAGKTVAYHTLGCKLNFAETSAIARLFSEKGFEKKPFTEKADVYVLNTCSVTANADQECRSLVRSALARNPDAFVAVVGCYAQLKPGEIASIPGVDVVLGANEKFKLLDHISDTGKNPSAVVRHCDIDSVSDYTAAFSSGDRTRTFLKVQDGCDYSCTFCTIPLARGGSRSDTVANVLATAKRIAETGVREIVLTGVNLGDFGYGISIGDERKVRRETLLDLVRALDLVEGDVRFRLSSVEPNLLSDELIAFVAGSKKFCPHFHLPLQSGSDAVLGRMKRRYRTGLYTDRVRLIKKLMPDACIGADVIVGFPGETEAEFMETVGFIEALDVSYLHVFTYSERDSTEAALMAGVIPVTERKRRNAELRMLSAKKLRAFYSSQLGRPLTVLFEHEERNGLIQGYSENYVRVSAPFRKSLCNAMEVIECAMADEDGTLRAKTAGSTSLLPA
jgi:threonylcarbamoyladenosine tRNA methylthiotransferase MtaB